MKMQRRAAAIALLIAVFLGAAPARVAADETAEVTGIPVPSHDRTTVVKC